MKSSGLHPPFYRITFEKPISYIWRFSKHTLVYIYCYQPVFSNLNFLLVISDFILPNFSNEVEENNKTVLLILLILVKKKKKLWLKENKYTRKRLRIIVQNCTEFSMMQNCTMFRREHQILIALLIINKN